MNTIEKAARYSVGLKQHFGIGVHESLDLAEVLDEMVAEITYDQTIIDVLILDKDALSKKVTAQRRVLEKVLDTLTTVYGLGTETPIIKEIQEILKCN